MAGNKPTKSVKLPSLKLVWWKLERYSSAKSWNFTDVCMIGGKLMSDTSAKLCSFVEQYISSPRLNPGFRLTVLLKTWSRCIYLVRLQLRPSMHLGRRLSNIPMVHDSPSFLSFSHFPPSNTLYEQNRPALHWLSSSQGDFARPVRSKNNDYKTNNNIAKFKKIGNEESQKL